MSPTRLSDTYFELCPTGLTYRTHMTLLNATGKGPRGKGSTIAFVLVFEHFLFPALNKSLVVYARTKKPSSFQSMNVASACSASHQTAFQKPFDPHTGEDFF